MLVLSIFPAPHLYPSDTEETHAKRAGMGRLRHKLRHKQATFARPKLDTWVETDRSRVRRRCPQARGTQKAVTHFRRFDIRKNKTRKL